MMTFPAEPHGLSLRGTGCVERLRILHDFYRVGEESEFRFDLRESMKSGRSFKDAICPDSMEFKKDHFIMGGKYGRVLFPEGVCQLHQGLHDQ